MSGHRPGRNSRTGERVHVPPKKAVHFKPGDDLRDQAGCRSDMTETDLLDARATRT
ncbi:MAG: HU family DNA-binding protein [Acidithiobacillus sp.]